MKIQPDPVEYSKGSSKKEICSYINAYIKK
jgi:hypothetical protein